MALNILLGILALSIALTFGTNQHLICKRVDAVFGDGVTPSYSQTTPRNLRGPAGKRGQPGVKGDPGIPGLKGEKGLPGLVDPQNVENVVEEKMGEANREFQERIEKLERVVTKMNISITELQVAKMNSSGHLTDTTDKRRCDEGFLHKGKCYFAILHGTMDTNHQEARNLCTANGGTAADILSLEHEELVVDHIRSKRSAHIELWLGMSYTPSTPTLRWSNGDKVPEDVAASMRWWPSYPILNSNWDKVLIIANPSLSGLVNYHSTLDINGVLCEKRASS